jgi:hypothetical protein
VGCNAKQGSRKDRLIAIAAGGGGGGGCIPYRALCRIHGGAKDSPHPNDHARNAGGGCEADPSGDRREPSPFHGGTVAVSSHRACPTFQHHQTPRSSRVGIKRPRHIAPLRGQPPSHREPEAMNPCTKCFLRGERATPQDGVGAASSPLPDAQPVGPPVHAGQPASRVGGDGQPWHSNSPKARGKSSD